MRKNNENQKRKEMKRARKPKETAASNGVEIYSRNPFALFFTTCSGH